MIKHYQKLLPVVVLIMFLGLASVGITGVTATETPLNARTSTLDVGSYSSSPGAAIPDGGPGLCNTNAGAPATDTITIPDGGTINDVDLVLDISHTYTGDVQVVITSPAGTSVSVVENVGNPTAPGGGGGCGCFENNITTTLDDESAGGSVEDACPPTGANYTPQNPLSAFDGESLTGTWTIDVYDWSGLDTGTLNSWGLTIDYTPAVAPPPALVVPNLGLVQIANWQAIQPYGSPGMDQLSFVLPADADGNGFDTYVVAEVVLYGGEYWVGLFIGSGDWVYVPYSAVTPLTGVSGIE